MFLASLYFKQYGPRSLWPQETVCKDYQQTTLVGKDWIFKCECFSIYINTDGTKESKYIWKKKTFLHFFSTYYVRFNNHNHDCSRRHNFVTSFLIFTKNKVWYFMRIVYLQTILMKYHVLFVILEKNSKIWNCRLLQIIGSALWIKETLYWIFFTIYEFPF